MSNSSVSAKGDDEVRGNQEQVESALETKKTPNPLLTPQKKDYGSRIELLEGRLSKTEQGKKQMPFQMRINAKFNYRGALLSGALEKDSKYTGCNCRKSQCLKMYCTCFAVGKMCDQTCLCDNCKNDRDNMDRSEAMNEIIERDPFAFSRKSECLTVAFEDDVCNCRKSNCTKKYCDCYRRGKRCTSKCNCIDCKNFEQSDEMARFQVQGSPEKRVKGDEE